MDLATNKIVKKNDQNIFFLNKIESKELFLIVNEADKCLAPHGLITNICFFLNKKSINLFNYQVSNFDYPPKSSSIISSLSTPIALTFSEIEFMTLFASS